MYKPIGIFFTLFPLILSADISSEGSYETIPEENTSLSDYFQKHRVENDEVLSEDFKADEKFEETFNQPDAENDKSVVKLNIAFALSRALESNRNMIGTYEAHERAEINLEINESFFDIQVTPFSNAGINGGKNKSHFSLGGGVAVSKKFQQGTWVSVEPGVSKYGKHVESKIRTVITQPLLKGFGTEYNMSSIRGAQFLLRSSNRGVYTNQISLCVRTVTQLYSVVKNKESLILHQASYDRLKGYRDAAKLKEKIGLSDAEDVYRAETALKTAEEALNNVKEQFEESEDVLKDILSYPLDTKIEVEVPVEYTPTKYDIQAAIDTALKNRIELDQVKDSLSESLRLAQISKGNLWPELNLVVSHDNRGDGLYLFDNYPEKNKREKSWNIGFTTSADLNKQADTLAYDQALVAIGCAQRIIDQTQANIIMEVKRSLRQLDRIQKRIETQELQIKTASGELKLAQLKFDRGYADNFNVIQAERNLISARTAYLGAVIDHIVGQYQLLSVLGMLCDKPNL